MLIYLLPNLIWEVLVIIPNISLKRIKEQWQMKSEKQQKISYKWILFNLYNILGLCFYNIFGERL